MMSSAIEFLLNKRYLPLGELEFGDIECLRDYVSRTPKDRLYKNNAGKPAVVASAVITTPNFDDILVMYHNLHGFYKQLGGHADGESDLFSVASREAAEEAGVSVYPLSADPFDFTIWTMIGRMKNNVYYPQHSVLDVAFLFCIARNSRLKLQKSEGRELKWISLDEWRNMKFDPNNETIKLNPHNTIYNRRIADKIWKEKCARQAPILSILSR